MSYQNSQKTIKDSEEQEFEQSQNHERKTQATTEEPNINFRKQNFSYFRLGWRIFFWGSLGLFSYNWYLNNYKSNPKDEYGYVEFFSNQANDIQQSYYSFRDFITKPPIDKLLPDIPPLPPGYEIPKTLVLNLSGTLLKTDFVFGKGQYNTINAGIQKRPGLQQFLRKLSSQYEIVVLSNDETMFTQTICEKLDPQHVIFAGRFGRESLVMLKNGYEKDLKYLNRPLNRIIVIDSRQDSLLTYQQNGIFIDEFNGNLEDRALIDLLPLLDHLAKPDVKDIRTELKKYGNINPQSKYIELLKLREQNIQNRMQTGMFGIIDSMAQKKTGFNKFNDPNRRI